MSDNLLLQVANIRRIPLRGGKMARDLKIRVDEVIAAAAKVQAPANLGVSVVIRTRNDAHDIGGLLDDLKLCQEYFHGPVQLVIVDTESTDDTLGIIARYKKDFEITVIKVKQEGFNYPEGLNLGFKAARYNNVFSLVGHCHLSNKATLLLAQRYAQTDNLAGIFGSTLPNDNATRAELGFMVLWNVGQHMTRPAYRCKDIEAGILGSNCAMIRRDVWEKMGGFDPHFGAGGEDIDLSRRALAAGYAIYYEPAMCVCHTHGVGLINNIRQHLHWYKVARDKPLDFSPKTIGRYRPDLKIPSSEK